MGKFIQYEIWKDCRNHCKFCYNYGQIDKYSKTQSLDYFLKKLDDPEVDNYDEIGFIGGEFFDNQLEDQKVREKFYKLFDKCAEKKKAGKLNKLYITTALMFDPKPYLFPFLDYLKELGLMNITLLCTSYDLKYRFRNQYKKELWESNMRALSELYPELTLHTEIIMTEFFMQAVLNDEFSITDFHNTFHTWIDYVHPQRWTSKLTKEQCHKILPDFFAHKDTLIKFLRKTAIEKHEINLDTFLAMNVRSDAFYCVYNDVDTKIYGRRDLLESSQEIIDKYCEEHQELVPIVQKMDETGFIDSDLKMHEVVKQFKDMYGDY